MKLRIPWLMLAVASVLVAQPASAAPPSDHAVEAPRLVVVIVVDQLRTDYLTRFREHFVDGGFNRFLSEGTHFPAARYAHAVTKTCAGHAVVLTGSHADINGIIGNDWYERETRQRVYCARDDDAPLIGVAGEGRSPTRLLAGTVGDELRRATGGRARVVSIAGKDRSAIMLGGHSTSHVYWLEDGLVTTSTFYQRELSGWVRQLNEEQPAERYFGRTWERLLPADMYPGADDAPGEGGRRVFPHPIGAGETRAQQLTSWKESPFANDAVLTVAKRAVDELDLGRDRVPDILAIGLSANDWVGHRWGPDSHEVMDITLRTDRQLADLFAFLDDRVGLEHVVAVLTADHGVAPLPEQSTALSPAGVSYRVTPRTVVDSVQHALRAQFGAAADEWVVFHENPYVYLDEAAVAAAGVSLADAEAVTAEAIRALPFIHDAWTLTDARLARSHVPPDVAYSLHDRRSGNVVYSVVPYVFLSGLQSRTSHGTRWSYDTHVPIMWTGTGIRAGVSHLPASVADIAPTLAALLGITPPSSSSGRVLVEAFAAP